MRLEYKIGIIVVLAVVTVGAWFFATRDKSEPVPVAQAPANAGAAPAGAGQAKQASPRPAGVTDARREALPKPAPTPPPAPTPTLTLDPVRSTTPGIRSESPIGPSLSVTSEAPVASPTTRPSVSDRASAPPPAGLAPSVLSAPPVRTAPTPIATAAPTDASNASATRTHVLKSGETISALSKQYYGSEKYTKLILDANPTLKDPRRLRPGTSIVIPPSPPKVDATAKPKAGADAAAVAAATPPKTASPRPANNFIQPDETKPYQIKAGDTWEKLAAEFMGKASDWPKLVEMNKRSPNDRPQSMMKPGQTIFVPVAKTSAKEEAKPAAPPSSALMGTGR